VSRPEVGGLPSLLWRARRVNILAERQVYNFIWSTKPLVSSLLGLSTGLITWMIWQGAVSPVMMAYAAICVVTVLLGRRHGKEVLLGTCTPVRFLRAVFLASAMVFAYVLSEREIIHMLCSNGAEASCLRSFGTSIGRPQPAVSLFLAPYVETYITNGLIQTYAFRISKRYAIWIAALAFIVPHFSINASIICAGIVFAVVRARTKSLLLVFLIHSMANAAFLVLLQPQR